MGSNRENQTYVLGEIFCEIGLYNLIYCVTKVLMTFQKGSQPKLFMIIFLDSANKLGLSLL